jgi:hypothetical protein
MASCEGKPGHGPRSLCAALLIASWIAAPSTSASDFVIRSGQTVGAQTVLPGRHGRIQAGATVAPTRYGEQGVRVSAWATLDNAGTITSTSEYTSAVEIWTAGKVFNSGTIATADNGSVGVIANETTTLTNTGTIRTSGEYADAIQANGKATVLNSGIIEAQGYFSYGIIATQLSTVTNTGTIASRGPDGWGIFAVRSSVTNSGTISATGWYGTAIVAVARSTIVNTGSIVSNYGGIYAATGTSVINSGSIVATDPDGYAISMYTGTGALTLLEGSRIVGRMWLYGSNVALNLGRGENWALTFDSYFGGLGNPNTFGVPTARLDGGQTVVTFDPATTVFGADHGALASFMGTIRDGLRDRLTAGFPGTSIWAQGFGARADSAATADAPGTRETVGGLMSGLITPLGQASHGGLFIAAAESDRRMDGRRHDIDAEHTVGGAYARTTLGPLFADAIVTAGSTSTNSVRRIVDNTTPDGYARARGSYDGWSISPELTIGAKIPIWAALEVVPSVSAGYTAMRFEGFTETGSRAAVAYKPREVAVADARAQIELRGKGEGAMAGWRGSIRGGVKGWSNVGSTTIAGTLAGTTSFNTTLPGIREQVSGFAGGDISFDLFPNLQLFAGGDVTMADASTVTDFAGRVGASMKF